MMDVFLDIVLSILVYIILFRNILLQNISHSQREKYHVI